MSPLSIITFSRYQGIKDKISDDSDNIRKFCNLCIDVSFDEIFNRELNSEWGAGPPPSLAAFVSQEHTRKGFFLEYKDFKADLGKNSHKCDGFYLDKINLSNDAHHFRLKFG